MELASVIVKAEKSHSLTCASWRPQSGGVVPAPVQKLESAAGESPRVRAGGDQ